MELDRFRKDEDNYMEYIHKLPFFMGVAIAIIVGLICNLSNVGQQDTYIRMAISMIIFFIIGVYIRNTLQKIYEELEKKKQEEEKRIKDESEEAKRAEEERLNPESKLNGTGSKIDIKVDDMGDDFSPLTVSEYIKAGNDK
jgi:hypothetical protein